jgi:hypothetical protein
LGGRLDGHEPQCDQNKHPARDPPDFGDSARARQHKHDADGDNQGQNNLRDLGGYHHHFVAFFVGSSCVRRSQCSGQVARQLLT